jgi:hypothetical protein
VCFFNSLRLEFSLFDSKNRAFFYKACFRCEDFLSPKLADISRGENVMSKLKALCLCCPWLQFSPNFSGFPQSASSMAFWVPTRINQQGSVLCRNPQAPCEALTEFPVRHHRLTQKGTRTSLPHGTVRSKGKMLSAPRMWTQTCLYWSHGRTLVFCSVTTIHTYFIYFCSTRVWTQNLTPWATPPALFCEGLFSS